MIIKVAEPSIWLRGNSTTRVIFNYLFKMNGSDKDIAD